jgi:hypothetical protein
MDLLLELARYPPPPPPLSQQTEPNCPLSSYLAPPLVFLLSVRQVDTYFILAEGRGEEPNLTRGP